MSLDFRCDEGPSPELARSVNEGTYFLLLFCTRWVEVLGSGSVTCSVAMAGSSSLEFSFV